MTELRRCVFLDRDGVINKEFGYQITRIEEFELMDGLKDDLERFKAAGFLLIIVTNQSGIAKGHYTEEFVYQCYNVIQKEVGGIMNDMYFAPGHDSVSKSLSRKPDSLMFEKAMAKWHIDPGQSFMIGDKDRDLVPAKKLGMNTILLSDDKSSNYADQQVQELSQAVALIVNG